MVTRWQLGYLVIWSAGELGSILVGSCFSFDAFVLFKLFVFFCFRGFVIQGFFDFVVDTHSLGLLHGISNRIATVPFGEQNCTDRRSSDGYPLQ
jgi:hypothetical protein